MTTGKTHFGLRAILAIVLSVVVGAAVAGAGGFLLHDRTGGEKAGLPADDRLPFVLVALGAIIACGGVIVALVLYSGARIRISEVAHRQQAVLLGVVSGLIAVVAAVLLEQASAGLPGAWSSGPLNDALAGPIEEGMKLLIPVILLIFVARLRDPKRGFWMVMSSAAAFAVVEGIGYVLMDAIGFLKPGNSAFDHVVATAAGTLNRAAVEIAHPLYTGAAAAIIWIATATLPRGKAIGVGILGFLGAVALHSFNDGVLGHLPGAGVAVIASAVFLILVYAFWLRPQYARLNRAA